LFQWQLFFIGLIDQQYSSKQCLTAKKKKIVDRYFDDTKTNVYKANEYTKDNIVRCFAQPQKPLCYTLKQITINKNTYYINFKSSFNLISVPKR